MCATGHEVRVLCWNYMKIFDRTLVAAVTLSLSAEAQSLKTAILLAASITELKLL